MTARPSAWLVWLGVVVGAAATARLGMWQLDRAAQKTALGRAFAERQGLPPLAPQQLAREPAQANQQVHRRVTVEGRWLANHTWYLDNRLLRSQAGFVVVTPLLLAPGDAVLVQRGWVARDANDRTRVPALPLPVGPVRVEARIAQWPSPRLALSSQETGPIRQNLDPTQVAGETGVALRPLSLLQLQSPNADDALQRDWPPPPQDVWKHQGYALQWFAMSALIVGLAVWHLWIRPRRGQRH
jgi:surfeit locus 1 family protein